MNYLVLGASGFLGVHLCRQMHNQGLNFIAAGRTIPGDAETRSRWVASDYSQPSLRAVLSDCPRPLSVVHLAAVRPAALGKVAFSPEHYLRNLQLMTNILESCRAEGVQDVVCASSRACYSEGGRAWKEDDDSIALTLYGQSKRDADSLGRFFSVRHGLRVRSLRFAQIVGWGEHGGFLLNTWIDQASKGLPLVLAGSGAGRRQYVSVRDATSALLHFCGEQIPAGVYNIGLPGTTSIYELGLLINRSLYNPAGIEARKNDAEDLGVYEMDVSKAGRAGWEAAQSLEQALAEAGEATAGIGPTR